MFIALVCIAAIWKVTHPQEPVINNQIARLEDLRDDVEGILEQIDDLLEQERIPPRPPHRPN
jgi:uncharacterized protein YoxC